MTDLLRRNLPKWPQMLAVGEAVTVEQAKEVIRRTDRFFACPWYAGNDRNYRDWVITTLGIPAEHGELDAWLGAWGYVNTQYVPNDWIACTYMQGPYGWMNPDTSIIYSDNVGKWPAVGEILADWKTLAAAFPFVKLDSVLMDGECCEDGRKPVVGFHVKDGGVTLFDPAAEVDLVESMIWIGKCHQEHMPILPGEQGIPRSWIMGWGRRG